MKKYMMMAFAVAMMTACNKSDENAVVDVKTKMFTFAVEGDFVIESFTRSLQADGKDLTDLWVFDYVDGAMVQQLHQTNEDDDFGTPTLNLSIGTHHIYFVASRGVAATLNTDDHTLTFGTVRDTFWKDYAITITSGTASGSRSVTLDRVVTKLKVVFSDAIPDGAVTFNITPDTWYYGINYQTGETCANTASQPITINIPSSSIGTTNLEANIFGFSGTTEWTTDVAVSCKNSESVTLGSTVIADVPFVRNRISTATGPLFSSGSLMSLGLNATWLESATVTW